MWSELIALDPGHVGLPRTFVQREPGTHPGQNVMRAVSANRRSNVNHAFW